MPPFNIARNLVRGPLFKPPRIIVPTPPQRFRHDLVSTTKPRHQPTKGHAQSQRLHHNNNNLTEHKSRLGLQRRPVKFDIIPADSRLPTPREQLQSEMRGLLSDLRGLSFDMKKDLRGMNSSLKDMSTTLKGMNEDLDKMKWHMNLFVFSMMSLILTAISLEIICKGEERKMTGAGAESEILKK